MPTFLGIYKVDTFAEAYELYVHICVQTFLYNRHREYMLNTQAASLQEIPVRIETLWKMDNKIKELKKCFEELCVLYPTLSCSSNCMDIN
jgi:hypothetical protein